MPFPSPRFFLTQGSNPGLPSWQSDCLLLEPPGNSLFNLCSYNLIYNSGPHVVCSLRIHFLNYDRSLGASLTQLYIVLFECIMTCSVFSPALKYPRSPFERNQQLLFSYYYYIIDYKFLILYCFLSLWSCKISDDF